MKVRLVGSMSNLYERTWVVITDGMLPAHPRCRILPVADTKLRPVRTH